MKSLLLFTLCLFSGRLDCADVTGYKGGSVLINCKYDFLKYQNHTKYYCKLERKTCSRKIRSDTQNSADPDGRVVFMDETPDMLGLFSVLIKNVSQEDGGTYRCGVDEDRTQSTDVTLGVKDDACCGTSFSQTASPGETVTFTCSYPEESKLFAKYLYKVTNHSLRAVVFVLGLKEQKGRFSVIDHPEENIFNVNISGVTVEDGGVYLCGLQGVKPGDTNPYYSLFSEVQLQVSMLPGSSAIVIAGIAVAMLLIGGLGLIIYRLRHHKTRDSASTSSNRRNPVNSDEDHHTPFYEEIPDMLPSSATVYATGQKPKSNPTPQNAAIRTAEPPTDDFYSMAQLANSTADTVGQHI